MVKEIPKWIMSSSFLVLVILIAISLLWGEPFLIHGKEWGFRRAKKTPIVIEEQVHEQIQLELQKMIDDGIVTVRSYSIQAPSSIEQGRDSQKTKQVENLSPDRWNLLSAFAIMDQSGFIKESGRYMAGSYRFDVDAYVKNGAYELAVKNWRHHSANDDGKFNPRLRIIAIFGRK